MMVEKSTDFSSDINLLVKAWQSLTGDGGNLYLIYRGGRVLLALPAGRREALVTLGLYQPQKNFAKSLALALGCLVRLGLHKLFLRRLQVPALTVSDFDPIQGFERGSLGILLGNPEHPVRRAIVSLRVKGHDEVAKMAFGLDGRKLVSLESSVIENLPEKVPGLPILTGTRFSNEVSLMKMLYFKPLEGQSSSFESHVFLLRSWLGNGEAMPLSGFPEWEQITNIVSQVTSMELLEGGKDRLEKIVLVPSVRHGDFAPWNLRLDSEGKLVALDWEWGTGFGVPGFDLVHYLCQEGRLIRGFKAQRLIRYVEATLKSSLAGAYLQLAGWRGLERELFISTMAFYQSRCFPGSDELLDLLIGLEQQDKRSSRITEVGKRAASRPSHELRS